MGVLPLRRDEHFPLIRVMAAWFLDVDVFPGIQGKDCRWRMPVVGGGDDERVDGAVLKRMAKVIDRPRDTGLYSADGRQCLREHAGIYVTQISNFGVRRPCKAFGKHRPPAVKAHHRNAHSFTWRAHRRGQLGDAAQYEYPESGG
ncbi:MAG: hypothetical protein NVS4B3_03740 [Gemmatimonadaceae bacterium]